MNRYDLKNKGNTNHKNIFLTKKTKRDTKSEKTGDYSHNDFEKNENEYFFQNEKINKACSSNQCFNNLWEYEEKIGIKEEYDDSLEKQKKKNKKYFNKKIKKEKKKKEKLNSKKKIEDFKNSIGDEVINGKIIYTANNKNYGNQVNKNAKDGKKYWKKKCISTMAIYMKDILKKVKKKEKEYFIVIEVVLLSLITKIINQKENIFLILIMGIYAKQIIKMI